MAGKNLAYCESYKFKSFNSKHGLTCALTEKKPKYIQKFEFDSSNHLNVYNSLVKYPISIFKTKRIINYLIDTISFMLLIIYIIPILINIELSPITLILIMVLVLFFYYLLMEFKLQKTIVWDSKTMKVPTITQIIIRNLFRIPLMSFIDAFMFLLSFDLHDKISKTKVFHDNKEKIEKSRELIYINTTYATNSINN